MSAGLLACDEETVTGPGFVCDITNPVRDVLAPASRLVLVHSPALPGDTVQIAVVATNRFGQQRNDVRFQFETSDPAIATVNSEGVVSAIAPGVVRITAKACGHTATTVVTIVRSVSNVDVTPVQDTVVSGDSASITARAFGPGGEPLNNVKFSFSSNTAGVTVVPTSDTTAVVRTQATFTGTATITATGEGVSDTFTLVVLPRLFLSGSVNTNGLDAGDDLTCGIITTGQLYCWGLNNRGQLGASTETTCYPGAELTESVEDTVVVTNKPCSIVPIRAGPSLEFATVAAGDSSACALTVAGKAYCWGMGVHGEIGNGDVADRQVPTAVGGAHVFSSITVGGGFACALTPAGAAWCWGNDLDGQLGDARLVHSTTPIPVSGGGAPAIFTQISAGFRHTCALAPGGSAFCWGNNEFGQLGVGTVGGLSDTPVLVAGGLTFQWISAGGDHTCGVTTAGAAFCWGSNFAGQLGNGSVGGGSPAPVPVSGGLSFSRVSASSGSMEVSVDTGLQFKVDFGHTCGLTTTGAIFCWGDNRDLQLGRGPVTGSASPSGTPVRVLGGELPSSVNFVSVTTGVRTSCGVGTDGAAYCWGSNVFGALGNTLQAAYRGLPQRVATPE